MNFTINETVFNPNKFQNCPSVKTMDISIVKQYCENYTVTLPLASFALILAFGLIYVYADMKQVRHGFAIRAACVAMMTSLALINIVFPLAVYLWG
jgi:hypothetical protein